MMQQGERYRCSNEECGCEISVTKASQLDDAEETPTCCCGEEMELLEPSARSASGGGRSKSSSR